jgi:hypothetical protein
MRSAAFSILAASNDYEGQRLAQDQTGFTAHHCELLELDPEV